MRYLDEMDRIENTLMETLVNIVISIVSAIATVGFFCGKYREKIKFLEKNMDILLNLHLPEFKDNTKKFIDKYLYKSNSPLSLTEEGIKLVRESGFEKIFEDVKQELALKLLEERNPKTKYDTQEQARSFMDDFSYIDYESFLPIKTYAFEKGQDYAQILRAGSILLRDYYLQQHPEIVD